MVTTLRLPPETERLIRRIGKRTGRTKSEVVRDALALLAEREARSEQSTRPYARVAHLIGSVDSGGLGLSEQTGKRFAEMLQRRERGRRSR